MSNGNNELLAMIQQALDTHSRTMLLELSNVNNKLDALQCRVDSVESALTSRINDVETAQTKNTNDLAKNIKSVNANVLSLTNNFDKFKGSANERLIREEVKKRYGETFSKQFVVQGLSGLVRLALQPKRSESPYQARDLEKHNFDGDSSDIQRQVDGINRVCETIYKDEGDVKAFRIRLEKILNRSLTEDEASNFTKVTLRSVLKDSNNNDQKREEGERVRKFKDNVNRLTVDRVRQRKLTSDVLYAFVCKSKNEQLKIMHDDSGVGIMFFCATIPELDVYFPVIDLEFDIRGGIEFLGDKVLITAGEIKSSQNTKKKAKVQLAKRLYTLEKACKVLHNRVDVVKQGIVFFPASDFDPKRQRGSQPISFHLMTEFV